MAPKVGSHTRSSSLPSRSHPVTSKVEEHLNRLKASEATSTSSVCYKLRALEDLYECVDDMLQLPVVQQILSNNCHDKCIENLLDGSLTVLDVCSSTKDILSQLKDSVQNFESSLRRKRGETGLANEVRNYMNSRKNINRVVCKILRNLKGNEKKQLLDKDCNLLAVVGILREVEEISFLVFESVLSSISQSKARAKPGSWFIISKLMRPKRIVCEGEVEEIDELDVVNVGKCTSFERLQILLKSLKALESNIQDLEDGLERMYRRLIKSRVALLNILSQ
ncbi:uncharacterized protein LOC116112656 [Pistacia vera]|uniref:uncharacterized protein LOC116112656 n=1 Tax=Pistacia vera TaxID=55513 RepID=UPI001262F9C3|nr:uncharacterized protein LOC116112656 [Pistacia vera]